MISKICSRDMPLLMKEVYGAIGAKFPEKPEHALIDVTEWLLRVPCRTPRRIHLSDTLRYKILTSTELRSLDRLCFVLFNGHDFRPYLGDTTRNIRERHKLKKGDFREIVRARKANDLFFADWGLLHFHLGPDIRTSANRTARSRRVLIAQLTDTDAYLVDVIPHGMGHADAWGEKTLLEAIARNWPHLLERSHLKGVSIDPNASDLEAIDRVRSREHGVNASIQINGKTIMAPGLGISTDGSSTKAVLYVMRITRELDAAEEAFRLQFPDEQALLAVKGDGVAGFYMPETDVMAVGALSDNSVTTQFFSRLLDETGVLGPHRLTHIWSPTVN